MTRHNFVERSVEDYLDQCDADEAYSHQCQDWVDEQIEILLEQAKNIYCVDLPTYLFKESRTTHISTSVDELLCDSDSGRWYKCLQHMMCDDEETRERFGRQAMLAHIEECLDDKLTEVSQHFVKRMH